jgi:PPOX class probable F420-dependent enzyme
MMDQFGNRGIQSVMSTASTFGVLEGKKYLSLESFRKDGRGVQTPAWFAGDPATGAPSKLYVYSEADSGKAKRIRRTSRVRVALCDMRGRLSGPWIEARAEIVTGAEAAYGLRLINAKYKPWKRYSIFSPGLGAEGAPCS